MHQKSQILYHCIFNRSLRTDIMKAEPMNIPSMSFDEVVGDHGTFPSTANAIDLLSEVEVILGRDTSTQEVFLVYGRDRLREIFRKDDEKDDVDVLLIDIKRQTDELNQLLALVQIAKDRFDYVEAA